MHSPGLQMMLARARSEELRRLAAASGTGRRMLRRRPTVRAPSVAEVAVTIRYAFPDDAHALARLAALDSSQVPAGPLLVADVEGELRAALSLSSGAVIADPFERTVALVELLLARGRQLRGAPVAVARSGRAPATRQLDDSRGPRFWRARWTTLRPPDRARQDGERAAWQRASAAPREAAD
jgi:hypothetical protein